MAVTRLSVEPVDLARLHALESEWTALAEASGLDAPFLTYAWVSTWLRHFPERRFAIADAPRVLAFRELAGGALVGIAPLLLTRRPCVLGARTLDFVGADPNVTELRGVLSHPRNEVDVWRALLDETSRMAGSWDWMHLRGVPAHGAVRGLVEQSGPVRWIRETPAYVVPLPRTWEELKQSLSRNTKEALRRCYNAPARNGLFCQLQVVRDAAEIPTVLEHFFQLHRARAARTNTVRHHDVFASPVAKEFLGDVCREFAERGALRIFQLRVGEQVVAIRIAFVVCGALYLYFSGYDPAFAHYHVMTRTLADAIQYAIREGYRAVHLSTGRDQSKLRWRPHESLYIDAIRVSPTLRGRIVHGALRVLDRHLRHSALAGWTTPLLGRRAGRSDHGLELDAICEPMDDAQEALSRAASGES